MRSPFKNKVLVLSCATAGKERPQTLRYNRDKNFIQPQGFEYLMIEDEDKAFTKAGWPRNYVMNNPCFQSSTIDPTWKDRRDSRIPKILSTILFADYEYIVWKDANLVLNKSPLDFIDSKYDLIAEDCASITGYNTLEEEFDACHRFGVDHPHSLYEQEVFYKQQINLKKSKTYWGGCFILKNSDITKKLQLMWWEQYCKFSSRDQLSLAYCLQLMKKDIKIKSVRIRRNLTTRTYRHKKSNKLPTHTE